MGSINNNEPNYIALKSFHQNTQHTHISLVKEQGTLISLYQNIRNYNIALHFIATLCQLARLLFNEHWRWGEFFKRFLEIYLTNCLIYNI